MNMILKYFTTFNICSLRIQNKSKLSIKKLSRKNSKDFSRYYTNW